MVATVGELIGTMNLIEKIIKDCEMIQESETSGYIKLEEQKRAYKKIREVVFGEGAINEYI